MNLRDELTTNKALVDMYKITRIPGLGTLHFNKARALDQIKNVIQEMKKSERKRSVEVKAEKVSIEVGYFSCTHMQPQVT